jgi:hypothetical protein
MAVNKVIDYAKISVKKEKSTDNPEKEKSKSKD